jgi:hypothetical protein
MILFWRPVPERQQSRPKSSQEVQTLRPLNEGGFLAIPNGPTVFLLCPKELPGRTSLLLLSFLFEALPRKPWLEPAP